MAISTEGVPFIWGIKLYSDKYAATGEVIPAFLKHAWYESCLSWREKLGAINELEKWVLEERRRLTNTHPSNMPPIGQIAG